MSIAMEVVAVAGTQGGKTAEESPWLLREIQRCAPLIRILSDDGKGSLKAIYAGPTLNLLSQQAVPAFKELFEEDEQLGTLLGEQNNPKWKFSQAGLQKLLGFSDVALSIRFAYTQDSSNLESMTAICGTWDEAGQKENKQSSYRAFNRRLKIARSWTFDKVHAECLRRGYGNAAWFKFWVQHYYEVEGPDAPFGRRFWGTTPYEWNWFKDDIYDKAFTAKQRGETSRWDFYNFPSWSNPNISKEECEAELDNMPLWQWQMMYEGLYTRPAGAVFDTFGEENLIDHFEIPADWKVFVGFDFGGTNTAAVFFAEDPNTKILYQFGEYHPGRNLETREHIEAIKKILRKIPDRAAGGSHQESGWRDAVRGCGFPIQEPPLSGPGSVEVQYQCVYAQIKSAGIKIFRKECSKTVDQYRSFSYELDDHLQPDPTKTGAKQYREEARYHMLAATRGIVSTVRPLVKPSFIATETVAKAYEPASLTYQPR